MGTILDRIQVISDNEGITIGALERKIGASKGVLSRAINNKTDIQSKWIQTLIENYPQYSGDWLLTGHGDMMKTDKELPLAHQVDPNDKGIPLIPLSAMAGVFNGETTVLECECEKYIVPAFAGADFLIHVKGDSMMPNFNAGDIVACKRLTLKDLFFQWNKVYILDTDQGALIKRVKPGSDKDHVLIVSDNGSYEPFELNIDHIYRVALVIGTIRLE